MNSSLKKISSNKYELTVDLGREELSGYVKKAKKAITDEVRVDGFRKGKAPKDLIRKEVGDQYILEQALDIAVQDSLAKTLNEKKLEVLEVSGLNVKENSASKLLYTIQVVTFPEIKLPKISGIKVKTRKIDIEPKEVTDALDFLRTSRAKLAPKEGVVEKGDRVEIDFEVTSDGLPVEDGVSKSHPLIIGDNKFIPGFEEQLVGMKKDENKKFSLNAPTDYFHKSVAGKKLDFSVKVITVQTVDKQNLNDDFAKSLGRFQKLEELEDNIRNGILEEKKMKEKQRLRLEILARIFEKSKINLPREMVDGKVNEMIIGFDNELHTKGMELSFYLAHLGKNENDLRKDWRPEAERQVGYALILRKIAKVNSLAPSKEEIEEEANRVAQTMVVRGQISPENLNLETLKEAIEGDLTNEKVFRMLEDSCIK